PEIEEFASPLPDHGGTRAAASGERLYASPWCRALAQCRRAPSAPEPSIARGLAAAAGRNASGSFVVSQLGARMHYAVPRMLSRAGRLERLYTDIGAVKGWPRALAHLPPAMLPAALRRLKGRVPRDIPPDRIVCFEGLGLASVLHRMVVPTRAGDTRAALEAGRSFSRNVIRHGFGKAAGFYGMSGEGLEQLDAARKQGLRTAVEQIIAPRMVVDRLVSDEVARHPEWAESLGPDPWASEFAARERAEWDVADIII